MITSINLAYDYPVKWTKFQTIRDIVQNFYDALGYENFYEKFHYQYSEGILTMKAQNCSFNYEWLLHIGTSTKRESDKNYAGYFGEGFKIASLYAIRDYAWVIWTGSKDWKLKVVTESKMIDGQNVDILAYDITNEMEQCDTWLSLENFRKEDMTLFETVLHGFYYPENMLLGECIWADTDASIYFRSNCTKPSGLPITQNSTGEGIVFLNYQIRGSISFPIVICKHDFIEKDRERKNLYLFDVIDIFSSVIYRISAKAAYELLVIFKSKWYS